MAECTWRRTRAPSAGATKPRCLLAWRNAGIKGLFANYNEIQNETLVFDTNRVGSAKLPALSELFPETRVVCCVRDAPRIMDSIERLVGGNVFELSSVFGFEPGHMVYSRINRVATPGPGWHVIGTGDYSGRSDILFQNTSGAVDIWEMSGTSVLASNSLGNPGPTRHPPGGSDDWPRAMWSQVRPSGMWRMGWDSNPRWACTHAGFQDRCLKPLGHPSKQ